jgi:tRNA pseudouridine38-40 synthase
MRVALKIAYDGSDFHGYVRQPNLDTVEGELIKFFMKSGIIDSLEDAQMRVAGRTDKGVSSLGNVVVFISRCSPVEFIDRLNSELADIYVCGFKIVNDDFNPRHAYSRHYRYYLPDTDLDFTRIVAGASCFTGTHDFSNFARVEAKRNPVRTIENILVEQKMGCVVFDIFAQTFLWRQIRRMVASLEKIGLHTLENTDIVEALEKPNKKVDFGVAPAQPLILMNVQYEFEFVYIPDFQVHISRLEHRIVSRIQNYE